MKEVFLIAGTVEGYSDRLFYLLDDTNEDFELGDYVITEFEDGYNLVKIIAYVRTNENNLNFFTHTQGNEIKRIKKFIKANEIIGGKECLNE